MALAVPLSACGPKSETPPAPGGSQTAAPTSAPTVAPDVLLSQAVKLSLDAANKRVTGSATVAGNTVEFDVTFVGKDAKGKKISSAPGISTTIEFVRAGEYLYINADEHYWQAYYNLQVLQYLVHKWVRVPADDSKYTDLLVIQANEQVKPSGRITRTGTDTVGGKPVVVLKDEPGHTFFVAAQGEPYLLRFQGSQATPVGLATVDVTFSEFGAASASIAAPTGGIFDPQTDFPEFAVGHD